MLTRSGDHTTEAVSIILLHLEGSMVMVWPNEEDGLIHVHSTLDREVFFGKLQSHMGEGITRTHLERVFDFQQATHELMSCGVDE
jgi:hypothetical protein